MKHLKASATQPTTAVSEKWRSKAEELMLQNSQDCTKFLEAWARWDTDGGSKTSFDSWCREYFTEDGDKTA